MSKRDAAAYSLIFDPSRLYHTGTTNVGSGSSAWNKNAMAIADVNDDDDKADDESEQSVLAGAAIHTSVSMMNSSMTTSTRSRRSGNSSSMMYSDDDGDLSSIASSSSSTNSSRSTVVHYNPQTIHTGNFLLHVLDSSSSDISLASEESADHYFNDPEKLVFPLQRHLNHHQGSENKNCYIFTDDDDASSGSNGGPANAESNHDGGDDSSSFSNASDVSPTTWEYYNKERGRIVAHQLLQPFRLRVGSQGDNDTASISDDDCENNTFSLSPNSSKRPIPTKKRTSLLGRVLFRNMQHNKRFTQSTSPLDAAVSAPPENSNNNNNRHRVSDLAVQAIADAEYKNHTSRKLLLSGISSAVLARNVLVDFGAWEAVLAKSASLKGRKRALIHDEDDDDDVCTAILGLEETSHSSEDDDMSVLFMKTVSLSVQDFIFGKSANKTGKPQAKTSIRDGLDEARSTSEDVAAALGIADEGRILLAHIRGRAGIIDDLHETLPETDDLVGTGVPLLPWIHLFDQIWMPHYEEYVVRAVHAFSRRLMNAPAVATQPAF